MRLMIFRISTVLVLIIISGCFSVKPGIDAAVVGGTELELVFITETN